MAFINSFASYLMLMIVFVIVGAVAIALGITLRKKANEKAALEQTEADTQAEA